MSYANLIREKIKINLVYFLSKEVNGVESEILIDNVYNNIEECKNDEWKGEIENAITAMIGEQKIDFDETTGRLSLIERPDHAELAILEEFVNAKTQ